MQPIVDTVECQRDSPYFRQILEENEKSIDILETKLEKIIKQCSLMVSAGKTFNHEQEQLVHTLWELSSHFGRDPVVQGALNCLLDALKEAANYHKILIDQAARAVIKNFSGFIKEEVKSLKEKRHWFEKASVEMDSVLQRASTTTRASDADEMAKMVCATRQAFRHTSVDYMFALSMTQAKKRHEVVDAILSYTKAFSTFYHQGSDLCNDLKPSLDKISREVEEMREEARDLGRSMENRHVFITGLPMVGGEEEGGGGGVDSPRRNSMYPATMQGYLFKRNNNAFKSWNRRYFTLQNNQLVYRKRSGEDVTVMEEDLRLCNVKPAVDVERRCCFEVTSNVKSHVLQAESEEICQLWIEALGRAISSAIQHHDGSPKSPPHLGGLELSPPASHPSSPAQAPPTHSPRNGDGVTVTAVWKDLLRIPGNATCCDCGSSDPKWASINIGITLCIECSGIHRSLGVHYSKVRSLTLDKWDLEVVRVMEELGNDVVNQIYLSNQQPPQEAPDPPRTSPPFPPPATPDCSRSARESWIRAKYIDKSFVAPISNEKAFAKILNHPKKQFRGGRPGLPPSAEAESSPRGLGSESSSSSSSLDPGGEADAAHPRTAPPAEAFLGESLENALRMESLTPSSLLTTASALGHLPLMSLSLALGADKNFRAHEGSTPLHHAIGSRSVVAVEFLLLNGAQVNSPDGLGRTPLHLASINANILQVYRLLKYRADWKMRDEEGKTPVDYAVLSSEPDLVTLLRVATLSEQLDKEQVEQEMVTIMQDLHRKKGRSLRHHPTTPGGR